ncbi:MAG: hypothetical protein RLZZ444_1132 [Pseudomonadota bacterium]
MDRPISGAEVTRNTLVESAIRLFGDKGYDAVSTREIADLAAANIGSIAYHFGGKPGLRVACAEHVIMMIRGIVGPSFSRPLPRLGQNEALSTMEEMLRVFCNFWLCNPDSRIYVNFILRELLEVNNVTEVFYDGWMKPMHIRFCELFGMATGLDPNSDEVKIAVFSFVGQVFHFRVGRPLIMRRLGWTEIGDREAKSIIDGLIRNARAIVLAYRGQS